MKLWQYLFNHKKSVEQMQREQNRLNAEIRAMSFQSVKFKKCCEFKIGAN